MTRQTAMARRRERGRKAPRPSSRKRRWALAGLCVFILIAAGVVAWVAVDDGTRCDDLADRAKEVVGQERYMDDDQRDLRIPGARVYC